MVYWKEMIKKLLDNKSKTALLLILILATILRFINYFNRWGLAYDQARDVIVATYALDNHVVPLIGPFSSAGAFVYGPQWFWILSLFISLYRNIIIVPWIVQTWLFIGIVYVMFLIGKELLNKNFGLILAFFTAISTAQIGQATNLTSPSMAGIFSIISIYFFVRFVKYSKSIDAFILGFLVATTVNIHFQAIGLLVILPIAFLLGKRNIKQLAFLIIGFVIPFIPLMIFDLRTNFYESKNMLDYYLYGQNRLYVPNRWLTYVGYFWPNSWALIIGGNIFFGYFSILVITIISVYEILKRKITKEMLGLIISFLLIFVMLRYYKGEIFDSYLTFVHPFILIFTSWVFYKIFKLQKIVFILLIIIITFTTMFANYRLIISATNNTAQYASNWRNVLSLKYPNKRFAVYDYRYKTSAVSVPLSLYLYNQNKIDDTGFRIGIVQATPGALLEFKQYPTIYGNPGDFQIVNLNEFNKNDLIKMGWKFVNPNEVYKSTEDWYNKLN